jgi:hypothetical protein
MKLKEGSYFTFSGRQFDPLNPKIDDIYLEDIAHSLSQICRFNGNTKKFYSVANHSILVMDCCPQENRKHALLHDSSESLLGDIISPLKESLGFERYKDLEKNIMNIIYERFNIDPKVPQIVKDFDTIILHTEMRDLTNIPKEYIETNCFPLESYIIPMTSEQSYQEFMKAAKELGIE